MTADAQTQSRPTWWAGWLARIRRTSMGPMLIRLISVAAGFSAVLIAAPPPLMETGPVRAVLGAAVAAAAVGIFPRSRWVGLFIIAVVAEWLLTTIGFGQPVGLVRVGLLAAAIYLVHTGAALAAVLPYDCVVPRSVLLAWAGRVGSVLAAGVLVGIGGMVVAQFLPSARTVAGPIVGSVIAAGLAGLLAWHLRRR
jgi:hypothetical protein